MLGMPRNNSNARGSDVRPLGVLDISARNVSCIGAALDSLVDVVPALVLSEPDTSG